MEAVSRFRWRSRILATLAVALVLTFSLAFALISHVSNPAQAAGGNKTYRYGPIHTTGDPDSGTCGNNWATDSFDRIFIVHSSNPYTFQENFVNGHFVTMAGASPGACYIYPPPAGNGNTVGDGVTGNFHGYYYNVVVTGGTFNPKAKCTQTTCNTTAGFCTTVYGPTAVCTVNSFDFDYFTGENGGWHNASPDYGGNRGDITGDNTEPDAPVQPSLK